MKALTFILLLLLATCSTGGGRCASPSAEGLELPAYDASEDIVVHLGYTASYNHTTLIPDWVAWELTAEEAGGMNDGQYSFSRDPEVRHEVVVPGAGGELLFYQYLPSEPRDEQSGVAQD